MLNLALFISAALRALFYAVRRASKFSRVLFSSILTKIIKLETLTYCAACIVIFHFLWVH